MSTYKYVKILPEVVYRGVRMRHRDVIRYALDTDKRFNLARAGRRIGDRIEEELGAGEARGYWKFTTEDFKPLDDALQTPVPLEGFDSYMTMRVRNDAGEMLHCVSLAKPSGAYIDAVHEATAEAPMIEEAKPANGAAKETQTPADEQQYTAVA